MTRPRSILLVDDHLYTRRMLTERLTQAQYDVTASSSAEEAFAQFGAMQPDLVLTDIHLAGCSGLALASAIRKAGGRGADVPILAMTADRICGDQHYARAAGVTALIAKPFSMESFATTVERLFA